MLIRLACDAYKAVSCICCPLLSIGVGLWFVGELDGELPAGVCVGVEGARDDVEHATSAVRAVHGDEVGILAFLLYRNISQLSTYGGL